MLCSCKQRKGRAIHPLGPLDAVLLIALCILFLWSFYVP